MRIVVVGGNAAGLSAAVRARRFDSSAEILVLERGQRISWGACGLPYYIEGQVKELDDLVLSTPESFSEERNVTIRTGASVTAIHHTRRELLLKGGEPIPYDKLILATGAKPNTSGVDGWNQTQVFGLHTLEDAARLKDFLTQRQPKRAVVIGTGYIGIEAAEALRAQGLHVTLLTQNSEILGRTDPEFVEPIVAHLNRCRVDVRFNTRVRIIDVGSVEGIPCDLVVLANGQRPNAELAAEAGIEIGRTGAIRVNDRMETSVWGIYAAGDCAETNHLVTNSPVWIPLGTTANKMGRCAGANAGGAREVFPGVTGTSIVRVCGLSVGMTGLSESQARREGFQPAVMRIESRDKPRYFRGRPTTVELVADKNTRRLLGGVVMGDDGVAGRINVIATALTARLRVEDFQQLDLAYAPPFAPTWDPLLSAAHQLIKLLH
ncbi:MAG: FAD-dependent oxidoreductase [Bryobacteraceae bacterium]